MKLNDRGITIIEVLIASMVFLTSVTCYFALFSIYNKSKKGVDKSQVAKELLLRNVIEIKGTSLDDLPVKNKCRTRIYDGGELASSTDTDMGPDGCSVPKPAAGQTAISWTVLGADKINITFSPSNGLKLPQYLDTLRQFKMRARYPKGNEMVGEIEISIYKRQ